MTQFLRTYQEEVAVDELKKGLATERLKILLTRQSAEALLKMAQPEDSYDLRGLDALQDGIVKLLEVAKKQNMILYVGGTYSCPEKPTPEQEKRLNLMATIGWLQYQYERFRDAL